jgi:hypothetical protein
MTKKGSSTLTVRFWAHVLKTDEKKCWLWKGATHDFGYGLIWANGRNLGAHRAAWQIHHGPIPAGLSVLHKCDNPACCNPGHLFLGTQAENMTDKQKKNRAAKGESHGCSKLTAEAVVAIRASKDSQRKTASRYGITHTQVGNIVRREQWAHIP